MSVPCFLVAHPKGTMMWDVGVVPDSDFKADGSPVTQGFIEVAKPLKPQLEAIGYEPADIKYIAFSHYHIDHTANANMFAGSTWLVAQAERDIMFSDKPAPVRVEKNYSALKDSKTTILPAASDYDVFGDGTVIIKPAPGHTPGHQVLFLKLPKTGPVLDRGRPVSLQRRAQYRSRAELRIQQGAVARQPRQDRRIPQDLRRATLDRARLRRQRQAEKIAGILRIGRTRTMPKLQLTLACWNYDRTRALLEGRVTVDGVDLNYLNLPVEETFFRMLRHREFDVAEMSLSSYTLSLFRENPPFIAIPVFPSRMFRHSCIYVHAGSGIREPKDLIGKRVGSPEYQMTAPVWIRGILSDEYGVPVTSPSYFTGGEEQPGRPEKIALSLPPEFRVQPIPATKTLSQMIDTGEIDALYTARAPSTFSRRLRQCAAAL